MYIHYTNIHYSYNSIGILIQNSIQKSEILKATNHLDLEVDMEMVFFSQSPFCELAALRKSQTNVHTFCKVLRFPQSYVSSNQLSLTVNPKEIDSCSFPLIRRGIPKTEDSRA